MRRILVFFAVSILLFSFKDKDKIVGKKMPSVIGTTIRGTKIDSTFFKGKITLIDFMYIGCPPCMQEAKELPETIKTFEGTNFQVLAIAANTREHLMQFNTKGNGFSQIRMYFGVDSIRYEIMPECLKSKMEITAKGDTIMGAECDDIAKRFKVDGYPHSVLINEKGIVVKMYSGYGNGSEQEFEQDIKALLKQNIK